MSFYKAEQLNLRGLNLEKKVCILSVILFASVWDRHRRGMVWRADAENIMRGLCGGTWIIWYGRWATLPYGKVGIICHGLVLNCMVLPGMVGIVWRVVGRQQTLGALAGGRSNEGITAGRLRTQFNPHPPGKSHHH